jgi:hypothetical protein
MWGETRNAYRILVIKTETGHHLRYTGISENDIKFGLN